MAFFLPVRETHHIVEDDIDGVFLPVFEAHHIVEDGIDGVFLPVFEAHHIVEDGVDRGAEVVEKTRYIEEVLVHPTKRLKRKIKNIC